MKGRLAIGRKAVGPGAPCFVIAEAGVNHNGSLRQALALVDAAAGAGADAVKFQTFSAERLAAPGAGLARYQEGSGRSQRDMLRRLELTPAMHRALLGRCRRKGLLFLSSPFDEESADLLDRLGVAAFKIPSGELTNLPFLSHVARKGRPVILSTGMADMKEVAAAVRTIRRGGHPPLVLLQCVSLYPTEPRLANLRAMDALARAFRLPVGFSDHTLGTGAAVAAAALGACVIEKHFTLDRGMPGPDHKMSLEPKELGEMIRAIRDAQAALGDGRKRPAAGERAIARVARKSLVAARDIPAGEALTASSVARMRPGTGLAPAALPRVLGRRARRFIAAGTLLRPGMWS